MSEAVKQWYEFALQQVAAESYLDRFLLEGVRLELVLQDGNTDTRRTVDGQPSGYTRMPAALAAEFSSKYQIAAHHANDSTGFSGTLLRWTNEQGGTEYTLSLRSTEFKPFDKGGDRERDNLNGANGEIISRGFAIGQLAALEDFYQREVLPIVGTSRINVTGYSLGGHLATVFTETHANAIKATYVFNGAGRGEVAGEGGTTAERMAGMIAQFRAALVSEPNPDVLNGLPPATRKAFMPLYESALKAHLADPGWNPFAPGDASVYRDPRYRWAEAVTSTLGAFPTKPAAPFRAGLGTAGDSLITGIYGSALKQDSTLVANSQIHASNKHAVYIEGQPFIEGLPAGEKSDFGNTHAITLIVDSLALMREFQRLDPNLGQAQIELLIGASSAKKAKAAAPLSDSDAAEGDSLEKALFSLRRAFDPEAAEVQSDAKPGGFGDIGNREAYYQDLARLPQQGTYRIEVLADKSASQIALLAMRADDTGAAVRYALRQLEPFAVVGGNYAGSRFPDGEIDLYDPATGRGLTGKWVEARSRFLETLSRYRLADGDLTVAQIGDFFQDQERGITLGSPQPGRARVIFGSDTNEQALVGLDRDDLIFGGANGEPITANGGNDHVEGGGGIDVVDGGSGTDELHGGAGDDHLSGGADGDRLYGEADDDTLKGEGGPDFLSGGEGDDTLAGAGDRNILEGGAGFDRYIVQTGVGTHTVRDTDGRGAIEIDGQSIDGGQRKSGNLFSSADGRVNYEFVGDPVLGGTLSINGQVRVQNFRNGDLGIHLTGSPLPEAPTPVYTFIHSHTPVGGAPGVAGASELNDHVISGPIDAAHPTVIIPTNTALLYSGDDFYEGGINYHDGVFAGPGDDLIRSAVVPEGFDEAPGTAGYSDYLVGDAGRDTIVAGDGNDEIWGDFSMREVGPYSDSTTLQDGQRVFHLGDVYVNVYDIGSGRLEFSASWGDARFAAGTFDAAIPFPGNDSLDGAAAYVLGSSLAGVEPDIFDDDIDGAPGDDVIRGGPGGDRIRGGAGNDVVYGDRQKDAAQYQSQRLTFGPYADLFGRPGDDFIDGGEGNDVISDILGGSDALYGGPGDDAITSGESWTELVQPDAAAVNILSGDDGADTIGSRNHLPFGFDAILGGSGNDRITAEATNAYIDGGDGDDRITAWLSAALVGSDRSIRGGDGSDSIMIYGSADVLGGSGDDFIWVTPKVPSLFPGLGDDRFAPDAVIPTIDGGAGNDTYLVTNGVIRDESGDDALTVFLASAASLESTFEAAARGLVRLPPDLTLHQEVAGSGYDLIVRSTQTFAGQTWDSSLTIADWFAGATPPIEHVVMEEGEISPQQLESWGSFAIGSDADETFAGGGYRDRILAGGGNDLVATADGDDLIAGGTGDDVLDGGSGNDTYYYGLGDGSDVISDEGGDDRLVFARGIGIGDVSVGSIGESSVSLSVAGGTIELKGSGLAIERLAFADGREVAVSDLVGTAVAVNGAEGGDVLGGNAAANLVSGGPGDDVLAGGAGDDTYVFNLGDGVDHIVDSASAGEGNKVRFGAGISPDMLSLGLGSLQIRVGEGGDAIHLDSVDPSDLLGAHDVDLFEFEDGTQLTYGQLLARGLDLYGSGSDDLVTGSGISDRVHGYGGDDLLIESAGDDTYFFGRGDGNDILAEPGGSVGSGTDSLVFGSGISRSDVSVRASGDDVVIEVAGGGGSVTVEEGLLHDVVERVQFADGGSWSASTLREQAGSGSNPAPDAPGEPQPSPPEAQANPAEGTPAASAFVSDAPPAPAATTVSQLARRESFVDFAPVPAQPEPRLPPPVGIPADPFFRDMQQRFDVLLQTGRTNLGERYAEAIREFELRRLQREEAPAPPPPTEEEIAAWNTAMHAWHERNPGFAETDLGGGDGVWTLGWGLPASGSLGADGGTSVSGAPGLANPNALPRLSGAAPAPALGEGLGDLR